VQDERAQNRLVEREVMLDVEQVLPLGAEIGQVVEPFLVPLDRISQAALVPRPAGQDLGVVALQDGGDLLGRGLNVARYLVGIKKKHAFVDISCHNRLLFAPNEAWRQVEPAFYPLY